MKGTGEDVMVADQDQTFLFAEDQVMKGGRTSSADLEMVLGVWQ